MQYLTLIDRWLLVCFLLFFVAAPESTIVLRLAPPLAAAIDRTALAGIAAWICTSTLAKSVCFHKFGQSDDD